MSSVQLDCCQAAELTSKEPKDVESNAEISGVEETWRSRPVNAIKGICDQVSPKNAVMRS